MEVCVHWNKDELLREDIDILLFGPRRNGFGAVVLQSRHEVRREEVHIRVGLRRLAPAYPADSIDCEDVLSD